MKKTDLFLAALCCTTALFLYIHSKSQDRKICDKEYFPAGAQEAFMPAFADETDAEEVPDSSDQNSSSQVPVNPPQPSTDKQYFPDSPASPGS